MKYFSLILFLCTSCTLLPHDTEIEVYNQVLPAVLEGEDHFSGFTIDTTIWSNPDSNLWIKDRNENIKEYVKRHGQRIAVYVNSFEKIGEQDIRSLLTSEHGGYYDPLIDIAPELGPAAIDSATSAHPLPFDQLTPQNPKKWKYAQEKDRKYVCATISLSKIAFNSAHDKGCFFYGFHPGGLAGHGDLIFIKQVGRKWIVDKIEGLWVA